MAGLGEGLGGVVSLSAGKDGDCGSSFWEILDLLVDSGCQFMEIMPECADSSVCGEAWRVWFGLHAIDLGASLAS